MAVSSVGYEGTIMPNVEWAEWQRVAGADFMVRDQASAVVSAVGAGTRQVRVSTGVIGGRGILDEVTAAETVQLPTVASGTAYHVIVARRTWQTTQATTFTYVSAGSSMPDSLPAGLKANPGVEDDQPLALVSLQAGSTVPTVIYDLRCIGGPNEYHITQDVPQPLLQYMARLGVVIRYRSQVRRRVLSAASGVPVWDISPRELSGSQVITQATGEGFLTSGGPDNRASIFGDGWVHLRLEARCGGGGGGFHGDSRGGIGDATVGTLTAAIRPRYNQTLAGVYRADGAATYGCHLTIGVSGVIRLISMAPNTSIPIQTPGTVSLWATTSYRT